MNAASAVPGFLDAWTGSLALFFILGLRHGAEPDHLAAVDGLTVLALDRHERHAAWTGALFALGHGLVVTALATAIAGFSGGFAMSDALAGVLDWIPILLLLAIGAFNLKSLLKRAPYRPDSVRMRLMPAWLRSRSDAWSTVAIGALFAMILDTLVHVSAWVAFATHRGGWTISILAGALFSAGMLAASTANSQLIAHFFRGDGTGANTNRHRRIIGWLVVILSFSTGLYGLAGQIGWIDVHSH